MNKKFIKPKTGLIVRHPETKIPLKKEGQEVSWSSFWVRRLNEGAIEIVEFTKPVFKKEKNKKSEK